MSRANHYLSATGLERRLSAHFNRAFKTGEVLVERVGEEYLISDRYAMFAVGLTHLALDSRRCYPELPPDGEMRRYGEYAPKPGSAPPAPAIAALVTQTAVKCDQKLTLTHWVLDMSEYQGAAFLLPNKGRVVVNRSYLALLGDSYTLHENFEWYGYKAEGPVVAYALLGPDGQSRPGREYDGKPSALIMPLHCRLEGEEGEWASILDSEESAIRAHHALTGE